MTKFSKIAAATLLIILVSGCASYSPEALKTRQTDDLCTLYYLNGPLPPASLGTSWPDRQTAIKTELSHRNAIKAEEWPLIDNGQIKVGIGECALIAAWGQPQKINHTVTSAGDFAQYVYSLSRYAYVTNGHVKSFQY